MHADVPEHGRPPDRHHRVRVAGIGCAKRVLVVVGGVEDAVGDADRHRITRAFVRADPDRAEDGAFHPQAADLAGELDARFGTDLGLTIVPETPAGHQRAVPDDHLLNRSADQDAPPGDEQAVENEPRWLVAAGRRQLGLGLGVIRRAADAQAVRAVAIPVQQS